MSWRSASFEVIVRVVSGSSAVDLRKLSSAVIETCKERLAARCRMEAADAVSDLDQETQRVGRLESEQITQLQSAHLRQQHGLVECVAQRAEQLLGARHHRVVIADHLAERLQTHGRVIAGARRNLVEIAA